MSSPIQTVLGTATTTSLKRLARIAGVFYLFVALFGGFSQGVAPALLYVAGDAGATAGNVVANPALVPVVVVAHLINAVFFVLTTVALYLLLGHVHKRVARDAAKARTSYVAAFGASGANALVLLLLGIEHYGILAAQVFFASLVAEVWMLGYLLVKGVRSPRITDRAIAAPVAPMPA